MPQRGRRVAIAAAPALESPTPPFFLPPSPAEFADVHFASVDIGALPALAARAGMEPPEPPEEPDDDKPNISQLGRKAKSHKGRGLVAKVVAPLHTWTSCTAPLRAARACVGRASAA